MVPIQNAPIWRQQQSFKSVMAPSTTVWQHHEATVSKQDIRVAAALPSYFSHGPKGHRKVRQKKLPRFGSSHSLPQIRHY